VQVSRAGHEAFSCLAGALLGGSLGIAAHTPAGAVGPEPAPLAQPVQLTVGLSEGRPSGPPSFSSPRN